MDGIRETGRALVRAARAQGAVELAFGETLLRLFVGRRLLAGLVSPCHARMIAPVVASNEAAWTALAMSSTVRELKAAVRAGGAEPRGPGDRGAGSGAGQGSGPGTADPPPPEPPPMPLPEAIARHLNGVHFVGIPDARLLRAILDRDAAK